MKLTITMMMGTNESAVAEVDMKDIHQWEARVVPVLRMLEARIGERNARIIAGHKGMAELRAKDPILANTCHNIILACLGQMPMVDTSGIIEKEWEEPEGAKLTRVEPHEVGQPEAA
jgi:hypothetical protein